MDVYVLIGDSNTKKSSTVRALTGVPGTNRQTRIWDVKFNAGVQKVLVWTGALQESEMSVDDAIQTIDQSPVQTVIAPLREFGINGCDDAEEYVRRFTMEGWRVHVAVLQPTNATWLPKNSVSIKSSRTDPANQTAAKLRLEWGIE